MEIEEREEFKQLMREINAELAIEDAAMGQELDFDGGPLINHAIFMENIGAVLRTIDDELEVYSYVMSSSVAYGLMASLLDMALTYDWLDDEEQWQTITDLFHDRARELVEEGDEIDIVNLELSSDRLIKLVSYVVSNWHRLSALYAKGGPEDHKKVQMIRSIIIGLRNSKYISYDPWLKTLLMYLSLDWELLGGGFGNSMGSGPVGWSYGG